MQAEIGRLIEARLGAAGVSAPSNVVFGLTTYIDVLGRWNSKINLTSFDLASPTPEAIDRLVVEGVVGARLVRSIDRVIVDIGSGGGSPAFPLFIAAGRAPGRRLMLVEARERKASFLREVIRVLGLEADVVVSGFEEWVASGSVRADLQSVRAVRLDKRLAGAISRLATCSGRVLFFGYKPETVDDTFGLDKGTCVSGDFVSHIDFSR